MLCFSVPYWHRQNAATESRYNEKKPLKPLKFLQMLKSCFGYGPIEVDIPSRNEYQRVGVPATGLDGKEIHGLQAEYLDEDNMAWGRPSKSKKQAERNFGLYTR